MNWYRRPVGQAELGDAQRAGRARAAADRRGKTIVVWYPPAGRRSDSAISGGWSVRRTSHPKTAQVPEAASHTAGSLPSPLSSTPTISTCSGSFAWRRIDTRLPCDDSACPLTVQR